MAARKPRKGKNEVAISSQLLEAEANEANSVEEQQPSSLDNLSNPETVPQPQPSKVDDLAAVAKEEDVGEGLG